MTGWKANLSLKRVAGNRSLKWFITGDVRHGSGVNGREGIFTGIAIEDEGLRRHLAENQAKDSIVGTDEILPFMPDGQESSSGLVIVVDTDQMDGPFRIMSPNPVKDEGCPNNVVSRNFVADVNNSQLTMCCKEVSLQAR